MSWDEIVRNNLIGTGSVTKAAICGPDGQIYAHSENFKILPEEAKAASSGFNNQDALRASGLKFEGVKYFVLQADNERVIGKKQSHGFFIYRTNATMIISIYEDNCQPEQCSKVTGALADYFKNTGY